MVGCDGGLNVSDSVMREQCEVEASSLFGNSESGQATASGASADRLVCAVLKKLSIFNCLPP